MQRVNLRYLPPARTLLVSPLRDRQPRLISLTGLGAVRALRYFSVWPLLRTCTLSACLILCGTHRDLVRQHWSLPALAPQASLWVDAWGGCPRVGRASRYFQAASARRDGLRQDSMRFWHSAPGVLLVVLCTAVLFALDACSVLLVGSRMAQLNYEHDV
jgi:hypothetical protein